MLLLKHQQQNNFNGNKINVRGCLTGSLFFICNKTNEIVLLIMEYFSIGKIVASHGIKGEVILQHSLNKKLSKENIAAIFIEQTKGSFIPFFVEAITNKTIEEAFIKIEALDTKESTVAVLKKEVWLTEVDFKKCVGKDAPIHLLHYELLHNNEVVGTINEVIEMQHQLLCSITYKGKEALIPVHDDNLIKIDEKKKQVHVDIPNGLLEIYAE
jgi:16S rRNA processing protein RimM